MLRLPVSIGEAVDKLTILDIKCKRITDPIKLQHCKVEYQALYDELQAHIVNYPFHYGLLYKINDEIWTIQDDFRKNPTKEHCVSILDKNDMRFRLKNILNNLTNSHLREQKGYPKRRALVFHHLGLGDHVCLIGAVRYVALQYDETVIFCYAHNVKNVRSFFSDDSSIKLIVINSLAEAVYNPSDYTDVYLSGNHANIYDNSIDFPACFYDHMKMDRSIRYSYFHIPISTTASSVYEAIRNVPYIFVHQTFLGNGGGVISSFVTWDINETLTLDPNINLYPEGHKWHELAQASINLPFIDYSELIKHAKEVHVVNSSFYCLAAHLELDASVKKCYLRETGQYDPAWGFRS